jgi:cyanophycin synthetase
MDMDAVSWQQRAMHFHEVSYRGEIFEGTVRLLPGANPWSADPLAKISLTFSERADEAHLAGLLVRLRRWRLAQLGAAVDEHGLVNLDRGRMAAVAAHAVAEVALQLQRRAARKTTHMDFPAHDEPLAVAAPAYRYLDGPLALAAGEAAFHLVGMLAVTADADEQRELAEKIFAELLSQPASKSFNYSVAAFLLAARSGDIPVARIMSPMSLIRFGHGVRQVLLQNRISSQTSYLGVRLASIKHHANGILRDVGLPVPRQQLVGTAEEAGRVAEHAIGFPAVIKPARGMFGTGVRTGIRSRREAEEAFESARKHGEVLVEQHIEGEDFRLAVIDGRFRHAVKRVPAQVVGDGRDTVRQLVDSANQERFRKPFLWTHPIVLDNETAAVLRQQQLAVDSVPGHGQVVWLRTTANLSTGGTLFSVREQVHPDNRLLAERAAAALDLDIAGIDFITRDIGRSWLEIGGAICEVNPSPGILDEAGESWIVDYLFPAGRTSRIPIIALIGEGREHAELANWLVDRLRLAGHRVGLARHAEVQIDGVVATAPTASNRAATRLLLSDALISALVVETEWSDVERDWFEFDRCDLLVLSPRAHARLRAAARAWPQPSDEVIQRFARQVLHAPSTPDLERWLCAQMPLAPGALA